MINNLPDELWLDIFDMAVEDTDLFDPTLPTTFSEASWFKTLYGDWCIRTAQENVNNMQRRSYGTKKTIMATCRNWRRLAYEFHFRFLFFSNSSNLQRVCALMDRNKDLGRWTRRLHITRYSTGTGTSIVETMENSLISIISHCPKLETFIVNWPLSVSLSAIATALWTYCPHTLRVLHINIPTTSLAKLIHMLQCFPNLMTVQVEFDGAPPEQIHLGSQGDLELTLPLQHLALRGQFQDLVDQAIGWNFPSLTVLSLDFVNNREDFPDIIEFLTEHGKRLTFLDLNCIPTLDVPTILDLCPNLTTFTFNPDWRIPGWDNGPSRDTFIVNQPHAHLKTIGLHHLMYAFGVGFAASYTKLNPSVPQSIRRQNDINFAALNKRNFPHLQSIRLLNTTLLTDLEKNNGPSQGCFERWERWWKQCQREGVRLEDCTGAPLGTLPEDPEDDAFTESGVTDEEGEGTGAGQLSTTLRQLLLECRQMDAQRELDFPSPALRMIYTGTSRLS